MQRDDYYPFGLTFNHWNTGTENFYKLTGNEEQPEIIGVSDFNARFYDASLGRFMNIDPLADVNQESWNPYHFNFDNPLRFIDPTGLYSTEQWKKDNGVTDDDLDNVYTAPSESNDSDENDGDDPIKKDYKGKVELDGATPIRNPDGSPNEDAYNCHSYAWSDCLGDPDDPTNQNLVEFGITRWDNNPMNNAADHTALDFDAPNLKGDKVVYFGWDEKSKKVKATHSALVTKVDATGRTVEVESKWGQAPLYRHHPRDVPTSYGATSPTFVAPDGKTYASRIYFRKK